MKSRASSYESIIFDNSKLGLSASFISVLSGQSKQILFRISLSDRHPSALNKITKGIGSLIRLIVVVIWLSCLAEDSYRLVLNLLCLDLIWIVNSWGGLFDFSAYDLNSATHEYLDGGFLKNTLTVLLPILSCATITFSLPLMMK